MKEEAAFLAVLFLYSSAVYAAGAETVNLRFVNPQVTADTNIHFDERFCTECHERNPVRERLFLRFDDYVQTCRCHGYTPDTYTHPVDIELSPAKRAKIPPGLPLENNKITCNTCHIISLQCKEDEDLKRQNKMFLRVYSLLSRTAICYLCHDEKSHNKLNPHDQLDEAGNIVEEKCLYCHQETPDPQRGVLVKQGIHSQQVRLIGDLAILCFRCHFKQSKQHPINANHFKKPPPKILANMKRAEERLGIKFPLDYLGRVTCATCHNPHEKGVIPIERAESKGAGEKSRLRVSAVADNICLACHRS